MYPALKDNLNSTSFSTGESNQVKEMLYSHVISYSVLIMLELQYFISVKNWLYFTFLM